MNMDGFEKTQVILCFVTFKKMIAPNICQSTCLERM